MNRRALLFQDRTGTLDDEALRRSPFIGHMLGHKLMQDWTGKAVVHFPKRRGMRGRFMVVEDEKIAYRLEDFS